MRRQAYALLWIRVFEFVRVAEEVFGVSGICIDGSPEVLLARLQVTACPIDGRQHAERRAEGRINSQCNPKPIGTLQYRDAGAPVPGTQPEVASRLRASPVPLRT